MADAAAGPIERFEGLEILRIGAAIAIVWFHAPGASYREVAFSGLICFLLMTCLLTVLSTRRIGPSLSDFARLILNRARRLGTPWLAFMVIYALENIFRGKPALPIGDTLVENILAGSKLLLWYLPAAFVAVVASAVVARAFSRTRREILAASLATVVGLALLWVSALLRPLELGAPWGQWNHAMASVPIGIAIAWLLALPPRVRRAAFALLPILIAGFCFFVIDAPRAIAISFTISSALTCLAVFVRVPRSEVVNNLSRLTLGVYLIHALVFNLIWFLAPTRPTAWTFAVLGVLGSALATWVLGSTPMAGWVGLVREPLRNPLRARRTGSV